MKKTLIALAITSLVSSAYATTLYQNEGSSVDLDGRLHVRLQNGENKVTNQKVQVGNIYEYKTIKTRKHSNLVNDGSRLGVTLKHQINGDDLYALGRAEFRFNGDSNVSGTDNWGGLYVKRAYVGLGGNFGQVTFGRQLLIGDNIGQAGFDNAYGVGSGVKSAEGEDILTSESDSAVAYKYTGIEGLTLGANYNFANQRDSKNNVKADKEKNGYGLGAIYSTALQDDMRATFALGYTHDNYATETKSEKDKDGIYAGAKLKVSDFTVALDGGRAVVKENFAHTVAKHSNKKNIDFVRLGARVQLDKLGVYGNYGYLVVKKTEGNTLKAKNKAHQFMLGSDYAFHKQVKAYVEGKLVNTKKQIDQTKAKDVVLGAGLIVFW